MGKNKRFLAIFLVLTLLFSGCSIISKVRGNTKVNVEESMDKNKYVIKADLDEVNKVMTVTQTVHYKNNENIDLGELYFHVYSNAFKNKETAPFLFDDFNNAYKAGFSPGFTELESISMTQENAVSNLKYKFQGEGQTILKLELASPLKVGKVVMINMKYKVHIPPAAERFGYNGGNYNLGNWYPVAAVYDESGWNLDKYFAIGDPFYSDTSDYEVTINTSDKLTVAATGELLKKNVDASKLQWQFRAENMRDFAFIASDKFKILEKNVDGTQVKSYFYSGDEVAGKEALDYGVKSLKTFNDLFGKYPYPSYSVVQTTFPSGMEYPGIVYISDKYYTKDTDNVPLIITIVHETAHQWWYGIVGNDQIDEAWLDESFAAYSETIFIEKEYGKQSAQGYFEDTVKQSVEEAISTKQIDGVIVKSLKDFKSWDDYGPTVYDGGAMMLSQLREDLGDKVFFDILKSYVSEYKYKIAKTQDFVDVCEKVSGQQLDSFFEPWINKN